MDMGRGLRRPAGDDRFSAWRGRRDIPWPRAVLVLAGAMVVAATGVAPSAGARTADDIAGPADVAALTRSWERWAVHALVVPLLESDGVVAWTTPHALQPCPGSSAVLLDGKPLPAQRPLPLQRPQVLSIRLDDCWPLGLQWLDLQGTLDIVVRQDGARLQATVRPIALHAVGGGVRIALRDTFVGTVSLGGTGSGR